MPSTQIIIEPTGSRGVEARTFPIDDNIVLAVGATINTNAVAPASVFVSIFAAYTDKVDNPLFVNLAKGYVDRLNGIGWNGEIPLETPASILIFYNSVGTDTITVTFVTKRK